MKRKKKILTGLVISIFLIIQFLFFNPFTPISAIRWSVFWNGFVIKAYMVQAETVPTAELNKIPDWISDDLSTNQAVYRLTSPVLKSRTFGKEMQYWIVTKRENGLYYAAFSGY